MNEQDVNLPTSKFISSLVKSLQIICNGHVDFSESIELVGHINVRIDHKFKYNYIVDEHVSKEGEDSSTTFLSNSYHSTPPFSQNPMKDDNSQREDEISLSLPVPEEPCGPQLSKSCIGGPYDERDRDKSGSSSQMYSVNVGPEQGQVNDMVFKMEDVDDSDACMMLPSAVDGFSAASGVTEPTGLSSGPSRAIEDTVDGLTTCGEKNKRRMEQDPDMHCGTEAVETPFSPFKDNQDQNLNKPELIYGSALTSSFGEGNFQDDLPTKDNTKAANKESGTNLVAGSMNPLKEFKSLISRLASMCNIPVLQNELLSMPLRQGFSASEDDIQAAKRKFLGNFDRDRLRKMKEVLRMRKGKQKKLRLKTLLAEAGLSNEQLLLLAQDSAVYRRRMSWKSMPDGPDKDAMLRAHKKSTRVRTQERQQRLLEMVEMLKRNQTATGDPGITVISKDGTKKCMLHKSSVSVVSHNEHQLGIDNIDEVADALTGKATRLQAHAKVGMVGSVRDSAKARMDQSRRSCVKKKMKQMVGKMLTEIADAGYRVVVTSTVGSEAGSHSAELCVLPLKVEELFPPEIRDGEGRPEMTEEEYARQLEREQLLERQKLNEDKMKEFEAKLARVLSGAEEMFVPTRKRYNTGEPRPSDAERMKEYRKRLRQDPEKYQVYKQKKRASAKKWRKLGQLAAKVKVNTPGGGGAGTLTVMPVSSVSAEEAVQAVQAAHHVVSSQGPPPSLQTIVNMTPNNVVNMHCPQVFEPQPHQPHPQQPASVVSVHHAGQYVSQVAGMHPQHQQPITYSNDMEFVELIAASHNVTNQHYG